MRSWAKMIMFRWEQNEIGPGTPYPIPASSKPFELIGKHTEQGWGCEVASLTYSPEGVFGSLGLSPKGIGDIQRSKWSSP